MYESIIRGLGKEEYLFCFILRHFSYFSIKTYVVGTHEKSLTEAFLMCTLNICFYGELEKIITELLLNILTPQKVIWAMPCLVKMCLWFIC